MAIREVDAISDAMIETEREISLEAWGIEDTERDASGDRSPEDMGEGLEGGHEPDDEDESEDEESEGEEESESEVVEPAIAAKPGEQKPAETERALVPSGKLREATERARAAEARIAELEGAIAKGKPAADIEAKLDMALREIAALKAPRAEPRSQEPAAKPKRPDLFEDPDGAIAFVEQGVQSQIAPLSNRIDEVRVQTSMMIAEELHPEAFPKAFAALLQLPQQDPASQLTVKRIVESPNPGRAVLNWHKQQETLARVGSDPAAYEARIREETRTALMADPEFRKQLIAGLRDDAARGDNGQPRTTVRLPRSLNGAAGSNIGANRGDPNQFDDSDQSVAESAWR
jgi:hypothetical protein